MAIRNKKEVSFPRYQQIAVAIAERIVDGKYAVGSKIYARSTLASNFNVSPETARKAINVLVDLEIMEVRHGSGAYISSKEKAKQFLESYQNVNSLQDLKNKLNQSIKKQEEEFGNFSQLLNQLLTRTKDIQQRFPFNPYELVLTSEALNLGKTINELNIWHSTGATILAVQQGEELLISPGPYTKLESGHTIYFVGSELSVGLMHNLFFNDSKEED
ncbi:GntR family transcriptional regulator [Streptococcus oricebi]|uniref:GntR family transcriptional regulator n=1 Tax=Streptococcus oricebi TaxID=1547447 RepID=A0ABS5B412_9STRE|nr:GntR family transcriptional regulator [Streptococcus oricebi]MBP2623572.1 GntR family transcriptional regulator [Streptococcus oricebi]